jgi:nicotinamidase-related amidase
MNAPADLALGPNAVLAVIDMQRLFAEETAWYVPTAADILPNVLRLARHRPDRVLFTRFLTPGRAEDAAGAWAAFYRRWPSVTLDRLEAGMTDLVPALAPLIPPGEIHDKTTFSAFESGTFADSLERRGADTLILAGAETDQCVLATALTAVDRGYRVVVAGDAVTSQSLPAHRAMVETVFPRLAPLVRSAATDAILEGWV